MSLKHILINLIGTILRGFPLPCRTGLIKIGHPGNDSPVFLTCNYILTVTRVKRALRNSDCYLLIANSKGVNVWCASTGGLLNNHSVISVIKTSGIETLVKHRRIVLPQLSAAGIEAKVIREKTSWKVIWGPVYAEDIPEFLGENYRKTPEMRTVGFPFIQRMEMAVMWAFPFSLILAVLMIFIWRSIAFISFLSAWILPLLIFGTFPLYSSFLSRKKRRAGFSSYTVLFDIGWISIVIWVVFMTAIVLGHLSVGNLNPDILFRWGIISFAVILMVNIDLMGSTPVYKSGLHEERLLKVSIDKGRCTGCSICAEVCPRNCYTIDTNLQKAVITSGNLCVQCGACIVQCPVDALSFTSPDGRMIPPETIRKYKLNMMGKRLVSGKPS
ncbi:MAG: copper oxidase [Spirochaetes bacterium]|nr:copper oxidase [Spirochaetota bacterium]